MQSRFFNGLQVLALETRRGAEIAELIRKHGGVPFVAPSMREAPGEDNREAFRFAERLFAGEFEMVMFLTGVGTRQLDRLLAARFGENAFRDALKGVAVVARGPKPVAALREMGVVPAVVAPEPNTWRELLAATRDRPERRVAVQEYGRRNPELIEALRARGGEVVAVEVYRYALPEDPSRLREAARRLAAGEFAVVLFTTAVQIVHLMRVAEEQGVAAEALAALGKTLIGSIGPTTSEALEEFGLRPALEPSHPRMGLLVRETAERAAADRPPNG